jgi:hypothetical protein
MVLRYDKKCACNLLAMEWMTRVKFLVEMFGIFCSSVPIMTTGFGEPLPRSRQLKCETDHCILPKVTLFFTFIPYLTM